MRNLGVEIQERGFHLGILCGMDMETALKIKGLFARLGEDFQVNVRDYNSQSVADDPEALARVNVWLAENKLPTIAAKGPQHV